MPMSDDLARAELKKLIVSEIMGLLKPVEKPRPRPSIDELEKLLNSAEPPDIHLNPDGTVTELVPTTTTVGAVADRILNVLLAQTAFPEAHPPLEQQVRDALSIIEEMEPRYRYDCNYCHGDMVVCARVPKGGCLLQSDHYRALKSTPTESEPR